MSAQAKSETSEAVEARKNMWRPKSLIDRIAELEAEKKKDEKAD
jgi:hypothetical protein